MTYLAQLDVVHPSSNLIWFLNLFGILRSVGERDISRGPGHVSEISQAPDKAPAL